MAIEPRDDTEIRCAECGNPGALHMVEPRTWVCDLCLTEGERRMLEDERDGE